ncbi:MAG: hypothetical protein IRZ28_01900 [Steroidobacteraceae bacterium]|nr:hypothetical protein [Steroidobacteraceae bacterium]
MLIGRAKSHFARLYFAQPFPFITSGSTTRNASLGKQRERIRQIIFQIRSAAARACLP